MSIFYSIVSASGASYRLLPKVKKQHLPVMVITVYRLYHQLFYCKHLCVTGSPLMFRNAHTLPNCTHQLLGIPQCKQYPRAGSCSIIFQLSYFSLGNVWCSNTISQCVQSSRSNGPLTIQQCYSTEPSSSHFKHSSLPSSNESGSEYELMYTGLQ